MIITIPPEERTPTSRSRRPTHRRPVRILRLSYWYDDIPSNRRDRRERFLSTRRSRRQLRREIRETIHVLRIAMPVMIIAIALIAILTDRTALTLLSVALLLLFTLLPRAELALRKLYERRLVDELEKERPRYAKTR